MQKAQTKVDRNSMWQMKSMVFKSWLDNLRGKFNSKEVRSIYPYRNIDNEVLLRVIYSKDFKPTFFTIPDNLDLNPSDWEYLESQIRENIPQHAN